jgi:hypothetical protein
MADPIEKASLTRASLTIPIAKTGLRQYGGRIEEEWHSDLKGDRARRVYTEMQDNEPVVGAAFLVIGNLIRGLPWEVQPDPRLEVDDSERVEFLESVKEDMDKSWGDFIDEVVSFLGFGWSFHEIVYKLRRGDGTEYNDGRYGWRQINLVGHDTRDRWEFDEFGNVMGMWQKTDVGSEAVFIPMEKAVLMRTSKVKNNPEGRSVLRSAYRPWYFKKHIEIQEGIGLERDLAGYPVLQVPPEILMPDPPPEYAGLADTLKKLVSDVKRDEREGLLIPNAESGYKFELMGSPGARQFDIGEVLNRKTKEIVLALLTDFLLLGHEQVGSFALAKEKSSVFMLALDGWVQTIAETIHDQCVKPLFRINKIDTSFCPRIVPGEANLRDVSEVVETLSKMATANLLGGLTDTQVRQVFRELGLEEPTDEEMEQVQPQSNPMPGIGGLFPPAQEDDEMDD